MSVVPQFIGRLGNSMFQIAACIGYAKKYGYKWAVPDDQRESSILTHFPNLPRNNSRPKRYNEHQPGHDHDWFNYHDIPDVGPDVTLFGFWQSWKYFENAQEEVKKVFKLDHIPGYEDYVSIHVRRGDYVKHSGSFPPITEDYIFEACRNVIGRDFYNKIKGFVFISDDIQWCKEIGKSYLKYPVERNLKLITLLGKNVEFSEGRNEFQDLSLMASCGHHIIANSSFSWWGAWLGHNPNKIVVSPSHVRGNWFGLESGVKQDCVDLLPPDWIQIKFR